MVRGLLPISHAEQFCDTCVLTKHHHGVFLKQSKYHTDKALELVHGDLCGPVKPATPQRAALFPTARRRCHLLYVGCAPDSQVGGIECHQRIQAASEKECGCNLRVLRTDNRGEFTAAEFANYCADEGITRHFSAPYTPR
jgi:hypothetical protein